ncbi:MAG: sigma-70 family RNA polymerase sigma factor, partial [Bdellovibrionales bacterium]|nr:sigma-70 family RNA polymerase sigma factor [Bdellovibrionales bacterium]
MKSKTKKRKKDAQIAELESLADSDQLSPRSIVVPGTDNLVVEVLEREDDKVESKSREVVSYNPLTAYLREMRNFPKLTREEEKELAVQYRENKDLEAAYQLVSSNLWLVVKIARDYEKAARSLLDLIQEGNIGLMEAVKNFDPYRGVRFPSYAVWWIRAYIVRYLIANWRMVKIGTTQAQRKLFFNLQKEKEKLERDGFYPGPKLLAEKLEVKEKEIIEMQ